MRRSLHHLAAALLVLSCVACSSSGDGDEGGTTGPGSAPEAGTAGALGPPDVPGDPAPGAGALVLGGATSDFEVTACALEPDPDAPDGARAMVNLTGTGTTARGDAFTVEVQRFATGVDPVTYTDTVTYSDPGRILQAQRIEVAGQVTDLRDPEATSSLLRLRPGGLTLQALASGPGEDADDGGLIGIALNATC